MKLHKYFAFGSLICMIMAIYTGHKMISGNKKAKDTYDMIQRTGKFTVWVLSQDVPFEFVWRHIVAMAMNSFRIVESFQIFKNQLVCLLIVANFKAIEPFTFDNRMKGFNACIILWKSFLRITALHIFVCFFIFLCNILAATIRMDNSVLKSESRSSTVIFGAP